MDSLVITTTRTRAGDGSRSVHDVPRSPRRGARVPNPGRPRRPPGPAWRGTMRGFGPGGPPCPRQERSHAQTRPTSCSRRSRLAPPCSSRSPRPWRPGQPAKRAITLDDLAKIKSVGDPQRSPDGKWVAYIVGTDRRREGQARHRPLDGELGRRAAGAAHLGARERELAALEPGRPLPGVPRQRAARGREEEGRAGLAARPRRAARRRSSPTIKGGVERLRLVARQQAARARRRATRTRPTSPRRRKAGSARPRRPS